MYFRVTLFRLFSIILHYANYVTDIIMMITFWNSGNYAYFWITLAAAIISWIICFMILLDTLSFKQVSFLMVTHLDFAFLTLHESDSYSVHQGIRKYTSTGIQASIAFLITINFFFTEHNDIVLDTYISLIVSLFDIAFAVTMYNHFHDDMTKVRMDMEALWLIYKDYFIMLLQVYFMGVAFGFVSVLYPPWGAWVFVGGGLLITAALIPILTEWTRWDEYLILILSSSVFSEINDKSKVETSPFRFQRAIVMIVFYISVIIAHERFEDIVEENFLFAILFYSALVSFVLWLLYNIFTRFQSIEGMGSRYYLNDPVEGTYYDCCGLFDGN